MLHPTVSVGFVVAVAFGLTACGREEAAAKVGGKTTFAVTSEGAHPFTFLNSAVYELPVGARRHQLWVDLPVSYNETDRPYPVVATAATTRG